MCNYWLRILAQKRNRGLRIEGGILRSVLTDVTHYFGWDLP
jgi:hypothetical protein